MTVGSGSGGGSGRVVLAMFVVVSIVVSPVLACGGSIKTPRLSVGRTMWLRGVGEEVTFTPVGYTEEPCVLLPKASHQSFNTFSSCPTDKTQAEAEMLGAEESSSSAPSSAKPQSRGLDPPPTTYTLLHTTTTTAPPQSSQAPPTSAITLELPSTGSRAESLNTNLKTTAAPSSTKHPPLIDDGGMGTTLGQDTTEMPDSTTEHVIEDRTAETTHGSTTSPTPDSSSINNNSTQDTGQTGKTPLLAKAHPPLTRNKNISVRELTVQSGGGQVSGEHVSGDHDDHIIYFAGAGAGVAMLVLGVVVVACVVHHRVRKVKKTKPTDLFMSGGYRGSLNSMDMSGSHGAYLNAHVMYSGAEVEFAESFELEERVLNSNISYSSHDIPKCLKGS
ncbi:hypothetical protein E2C01_028653 [Portunus trituberculatus]|uniref:Uncharacterized protein n=1 Tax=Portunus trituberculatus TaxID=210409 RepID=A0A5B7EPB0_PORTR|nr:hypothetical protein [Portunus trituberculatus]